MGMIREGSVSSEIFQVYKCPSMTSNHWKDSGRYSVHNCRNRKIWALSPSTLFGFRVSKKRKGQLSFIIQRSQVQHSTSCSWCLDVHPGYASPTNHVIFLVVTLNRKDPPETSLWFKSFWPVDRFYCGSLHPQFSAALLPFCQRVEHSSVWGHPVDTDASWGWKGYSSG